MFKMLVGDLRQTLSILGLSSEGKRDEVSVSVVIDNSSSILKCMLLVCTLCDCLYSSDSDLQNMSKVMQRLIHLMKINSLVVVFGGTPLHIVLGSKVR